MRLTHCTNFTGAGLRPLHGSTIIEQIDLSLVGDGEDPTLLDPDPPISCDLVLPILDSIIAAEGCSLKHLHFPYMWRKDRSTDTDFHAFILRYNIMRENRDTVTCLNFNCDQNLPVNGNEWIGTRDNCAHGLHNWTCYQCFKYYCEFCHEDDDGEKMLHYCQKCQRDYCRECVKVKECDLCSDMWYCEHCFEECNECHKNICSGCMEHYCSACSYCDAVYCKECNPNVGFVKFCEECDKSCCNLCRFRIYQEGGSDGCAECIRLLPHEAALIEQLRILQDEVGHLKNEVSELKLENKELKGEQNL